MEGSAEFPRRLSASDSVAWRIESNPLLRSTIVVILRLDRSPDAHTLRRRMEAATVAFPRLRQRVVGVPLRLATPVWAADPHFDLDYHLNWVDAHDASRRGLLNLASAIAMRAFDRDRPLWEWTVVDKLDDGGAAVIIKLHHSVTDGVGGVQLMAQLFDLEREADPRAASPDDVPDGEDPTAADLISEALKDRLLQRMAQARDFARAANSAARDPLTTLQDLIRNVASTARLLAPVSSPLSPIMTGRSPRNRYESFSVPVAPLKAAAKRVDGKLNDAYMTALAVGLRLYHEAHGESPVALRVNMPINLRTAESTAAGNAWAPARFPVPLVADDVDAHMRDIHDLVAVQRSEPSLRYVGTIAALLDQLPTSVLTDTFKNLLTTLDFAATNVPGAPVPMYFAGARVDTMEAFAPNGGAAVNFALLSYQDHATVTMNIDPAAIPDSHLLLECVQNGFDMVMFPERTAVGRSTLPRRRTGRTAG